MADKREKMSEPCYCPYCDEEIARAAMPWCEPCGVEVLYCPKCRRAMPRDAKVCPHCGIDVAGEVAEGNT